MLFNAEANLAFIHIPKNAGQSVRNAMMSAGRLSFEPIARDLEVSEDRAEHLMEAGLELWAGSGKVQPEHVPLSFLRAHFPHTWDTLCQARSFVMVRPPRDRFFSALLQRLREHRGMAALRADDAVVAQEARFICDWLGRRDAFCDMEFIHFSRQTDYVDLDGARIVNAIFPVDRMDAVANWVAAGTGIALNVTHDHARREPRRWAGPLQPAARFVGRKLLPQSLKKAIYPLWMNSAAFSNASSRYQTIRLDDEVEAFIADYYARDTALHEEAVRNLAAIADASHASAA